MAFWGRDPHWGKSYQSSQSRVARLRRFRTRWMSIHTMLDLTMTTQRGHAMNYFRFKLLSFPVLRDVTFWRPKQFHPEFVRQMTRRIFVDTSYVVRVEIRCLRNLHNKHSAMIEWLV